MYPHLPYKPAEHLKQSGWPEEDLTSTADEGGGYYPLRISEFFEEGRYVITRKLGWGGHSSVWLARDHKEDRHVSIKVLTAYASREIKEERLAELELLRKVANASPLHHGAAHVIRLFHDFTFESFVGQHVCLVTDALSYNVPGLQSQLDDPRLPLKFILRLTGHVLKGLEYLHDECDVIHADLKPGNILLRPSDLDNIVMRELSKDPARMYGFSKTIPPDLIPFHPVVSAPLHFKLNAGKPGELHWVIADLGHAHPKGKPLSKVVQPYALRAPEVILGLQWGPAIDIWSLGCMMYEFAIGSWLFHPEAVDDIPRDIVHLAQMTQRTGQDHDDVGSMRCEIQGNRYDLEDILKRATAGSTELTPIESAVNGLTVHSNGADEIATFVRVVRSFLALDPTKRPRAAEALLDPAFKDIL